MLTDWIYRVTNLVIQIMIQRYQGSVHIFIYFVNSLHLQLLGVGTYYLVQLVSVSQPRSMALSNGVHELNNTESGTDEYVWFLHLKKVGKRYTKK